MGKKLCDSVVDDDNAMRDEFDNPADGVEWRDGNVKSSFNYLLLDPR